LVIAWRGIPEKKSVLLSAQEHQPTSSRAGSQDAGLWLEASEAKGVQFSHFTLMEPGMRALVLTLLAGLLFGCMSTTRTREVHCLGTLMTDVLESEQEMESIKEDWRADQQRRADQSYRTNESTKVRIDSPTAVPVPLMPDGMDSRSGNKKFVESDVLYRHLAQARTRYHDMLDWYTRVARRVQTRFEEDEMLYSVLGMFVSSPASLLFYPIVRWNVRSVLWDGADPDADNDPIQQFCLTRVD
jgi:hypothetical protein